MWERGTELLCPLQDTPLSSNLHVFTNPEVLQTLASWVFMEASLQKHD